MSFRKPCHMPFRKLIPLLPSQKNKTVTFNDCILGIYGSNINDFKALPHAFPSRWFNPTFACLERLKMFLQISSLFLTEIENNPYI